MNEDDLVVIPKIHSNIEQVSARSPIETMSTSPDLEPLDLSINASIQAAVNATVQAAVESIHVSINELKTSVDNLKTSVRYNEINKSFTCDLKHNESYPLSLFIYSDITIVQRLVMEFCDRPSNLHSLSLAQDYLGEHSPMPLSGILCLRETPHPGTNFIFDPETVNANEMTSFRYDCYGIWKKMVAQPPNPQARGYHHEVLILVGLNGTITVVDWNIGVIPLRQRNNAVLWLNLNDQS